MANPNAVNASTTANVNVSKVGLKELLPVVGQSEDRWIPGSSTLINTGNTDPNGAYSADLVSVVGAIQAATGAATSVRIRNLRVQFSVGVTLSQSCGVGVAAAWIPSAKTVPSDVNHLYLGFSQSAYFLLCNAGLASSSTNSHILEAVLDVNGMTSQMCPTADIGNASLPTLRAFVTLTGSKPTIPTNDIGVLAVAYYEYLPLGYIGA
jgi:hypothetical protein